MARKKKIKPLPGRTESVWLGSVLRTELHQDSLDRGVPVNQIIREALAKLYDIDLREVDKRRKKVVAI